VVAYATWGRTLSSMPMPFCLHLAFDGSFSTAKHSSDSPPPPILDCPSFLLTGQFSHTAYVCFLKEGIFSFFSFPPGSFSPQVSSCFLLFPPATTLTPTLFVEFSNMFSCPLGRVQRCSVFFSKGTFSQTFSIYHQTENICRAYFSGQFFWCLLSPPPLPIDLYSRRRLLPLFLPPPGFYDAFERAFTLAGVFSPVPPRHAYLCTASPGSGCLPLPFQGKHLFYLFLGIFLRFSLRHFLITTGSSRFVPPPLLEVRCQVSNTPEMS